MLKKILAILTVFSSLFALSGCGYNTMQEQNRATNATWSEVLSQYQHRVDLIPNLVSTVKDYTEHEDEVLVKVTEARSRVGSIQMTAEDTTDPEKLKRFQQIQGELSSTLSRLLMVPESYPRLKANRSFRDLQAQLEGTENRITLARNSYIKSVQTYNTTIHRFPDNLVAKMLDLKQRANFSVENESAVSIAPKVSF